MSEHYFTRAELAMIAPRYQELIKNKFPEMIESFDPADGWIELDQ